MKKFQNVHVRIEFGKQLSWILFDSGYLQEFIHFIKNTVHTGSRYDYEKYFSEKMRRDTPYLRFKYPIIEHVPEIWTFMGSTEKSQTNLVSFTKNKRGILRLRTGIKRN